MAVTIEDTEAPYTWTRWGYLQEILDTRKAHAADNSLPPDRLALTNWPYKGGVCSMHARAGADNVEHWVTYCRHQMDDAGRLALQLMTDPEMASSANTAETRLRRSLKGALQAAQHSLGRPDHEVQVVGFPGVCVFASKPTE
jgi:hypothetical protein